MKKGECEKAIRFLCHEWRNATGLSNTPSGELSFSAFFTWLKQHYGQYLEFRSTMGAEYMAEMWFDQEFKQSWRN